MSELRVLFVAATVVTAGCGADTFLEGEIKGRPAFRPVAALSLGKQTGVELVDVSEPDQCAALATFRESLPMNTLMFSSLPTSVGERRAVAPEYEHRAGQATGKALVYYFGSAGWEPSWSGWVELSSKTDAELVGRFELTASDSELTGSFRATPCP